MSAAKLLRPGRGRIVVAATAAVALVGGVGAAAVAATGSPVAFGGRAVTIAIDLPRQGPSAEASADTDKAINLYLSQIGGQVATKAGRVTVRVRSYDNSGASVVWDSARCSANAATHAKAADEVAVVGPYNSGCAR